MKAFLALLNVSFKSLLLTSTNMGSRKRKKAVSGTGALVLLGVLMLYLSGTYSFMLGASFAPGGGLDVMLMIMCLAAVAFPLVFTIYASQSLVYSTKDIDLVMSLPVSAFSVMLARVMALYLEILLMVEMLLLPAGVAWLYYGGGGGALFIILLLVSGVFLAFIPALVALVFGGLISLLVSKLRFKNLFTVLFSLLLIVVIMVLSFSISFTAGSGMETLGANADGLRQVLAGAVPPAAWFVQAVTGPNLLLLLAVFVACLLPFLAVVWLFSLFYKRLLTLLSSHKLKSDYKLERVRGGSSFGALLRKEARKFFGTPAYMLNSGMGILLVILASVAAVIYRNRIGEFLADMIPLEASVIVARYLPPALLLVLLFFVSLTFVSSVSISLEGKTLWILKEAPLGVGRIFAAKAGFGFLLGALAMVVCVPLLGIAFALPLPDILGMLLLGVLFPLLTSTVGLYINLLLPRMDAENETVVIKQSASVVVTMLVDLALMALFVVLFVVLQGLGIGFALYALIAGVLLVGLNLLAIALLNTSGRKLFAAL